MSPTGWAHIQRTGVPKRGDQDTEGRSYEVPGRGGHLHARRRPQENQPRPHLGLGSPASRTRADNCLLLRPYLWLPPQLPAGGPTPLSPRATENIHAGSPTNTTHLPGLDWAGRLPAEPAQPMQNSSPLQHGGPPSVQTALWATGSMGIQGHLTPPRNTPSAVPSTHSSSHAGSPGSMQGHHQDHSLWSRPGTTAVQQSLMAPCLQDGTRKMSPGPATCPLGD